MSYSWEARTVACSDLHFAGIRVLPSAQNITKVLTFRATLFSTGENRLDFEDLHEFTD